MAEIAALWEEKIQPGATWSHVLKRGTALRITDLDGGDVLLTIAEILRRRAERRVRGTGVALA